MIRIEINGIGVFRSKDEFGNSLLTKHSKAETIRDRHCNTRKYPNFQNDISLIHAIYDKHEDIKNY